MTNRQDARARAERALRLRSCGRTWDEVAQSVGYRSRQGAQQAVERLIRSTSTDVETERATSAEALRVLRSALFGRFAAAHQAKDDELMMSMSKELRGLISEDAKLMGLHVPQRHEHDVHVTQTATAIFDRAEADLLALAQARPALIPAPIIDAEVIDS